MFTLEKTSNEVKLHIIRVNFLNKYLRWSRSRAKETAPAPTKYRYSGSETLIQTKATEAELAGTTMPDVVWSDKEGPWRMKLQVLLSVSKWLEEQHGGGKHLLYKPVLVVCLTNLFTILFLLSLNKKLGATINFLPSHLENIGEDFLCFPVQIRMDQGHVVVAGNHITWHSSWCSTVQSEIKLD